MKSAFNRLKPDKKLNIIKTCIHEFGAAGYDHCSLDSIIQNAGISKGGLYEYIDSKEDLFIFIVEYCYSRLYDYIENYLSIRNENLPEDILDRFSIVSAIAIDFYIDHPETIAFIVKCNYLSDATLHKQAQDIFLLQFERLFGNISSEIPYAYDCKSILELLQWLLIKTRNDFLLELESGKKSEEVKIAYLNQWKFYLSLLRNGIFFKK
ncbi:MAG TPA: TetR/AcrR family transcriptional regulator [Chitinispirillaceae bacterium]|nr:TetR/AcrR family transcriptional regulator [Chitinispirillaceae bacterium]